MHRSNYSSLTHGSRRGFTLIEIMVAIGIILVLVAASIAGMSHVAKHAKAQRTQTAMETARSMVAAYIAYDPTQAALKGLYSPAVGCQLEPNPMPQYDLDPINGWLVAPTVGCNGSHVWTNFDPSNQPLFHAIDYTQRVMQILLRVPENRAIMAKLPAEAKWQLTDINGKAWPLPGNPTSPGPVPPLLADGNGEPIFFVPPVGLYNVSVTNGVQGGLMQSDGRVHPISPTPDPYPNPSAHSFFVSCGPDRTYPTGDDNAYSFQQ